MLSTTSVTTGRLNLGRPTRGRLALGLATTRRPVLGRVVSSVVVIALLATGVVLFDAAGAEPAAAASAEVQNGCRYSIDNKDRNVAVTLTGTGSPRKVAPGDDVVLDGASLSAELPPWVPQYLYQGGLLSAGDNTVAATVWIAIEATNTEEGVQIVEVPVEGHTTITPADPTNPLSTATATPLAVANAAIPSTTWHPTGGAIAFRQAGPGALASTPVGGTTPIGSMFLMATLSNGSTSITVKLDCRPGTVDTETPPYAFVPATSWAAFDTVAAPTAVDLDCGAETVSSGWYGLLDPDPVTLGSSTSLVGTAVDLTVPGSFFVEAYAAGDLIEGENEVPVAISGTFVGTNPTGATVAFTGTGAATSTVTDGPDEGPGDASATDAVVTIEIDDSTWTPTEAGTVSISLGSELAISLGSVDSPSVELACSPANTAFASAAVQAVGVAAPTDGDPVTNDDVAVAAAPKYAG